MSNVDTFEDLDCYKEECLLGKEVSSWCIHLPKSA